LHSNSESGFNVPFGRPPFNPLARDAAAFAGVLREPIKPIARRIISVSSMRFIIPKT
jgi:hypothetical protein